MFLLLSKEIKDKNGFLI